VSGGGQEPHETPGHIISLLYEVNENAGGQPYGRGVYKTCQRDMSEGVEKK